MTDGIWLVIVPVAVAMMSLSQTGMVADGDRIVFFGDSLTELGMQPEGYVTLIRERLAKKFSDIQIIGAGISGQKVPDLLERLDHDVLSRKPATVVIYIGINDVWHSALQNLKGTPKDVFESGLREITMRIQRAGARVILCTPSCIGEKNQGLNPLDRMLDEYADITRNVSKERSVFLCDLRKAFLDYLRMYNPENKESGVLTNDGVHFNDEGNELVANELLKILK